MIIKIWSTFIVRKYQKEIEAGDIRFFLEKDYTEDVSQLDNSEHIMKIVNTFRTPLKQLSEANKSMAMEHIQIMSRISAKYNEIA